MHEIIKLKNFVKQHKELHFKDRLKYEEVRNKQYKEDIDWNYWKDNIRTEGVLDK